MRKPIENPVPNPTHFKYHCRECKADFMTPVDQDDPKNTPYPRCACGAKQRTLAFKGAIFEGQEP